MIRIEWVIENGAMTTEDSAVPGAGDKRREGEAPAEPLSHISLDRFPIRKHPVHGVVVNHQQPTIVFDTVCTKRRKRWLACEAVHELLLSVWQESSAWLVGKYVIMPDHIHYFATPKNEEISFENWVRYWKSQFSKQNRKRHVHPTATGQWQTNHWDTRLRNWQSYDEKWQYVRNNPVRHGLVARADDWPFQGEVYTLTWD